MTKFEEVSDITINDYFKNNHFSIDMFNAKYSHYLSDDDRNETPAEVFKRCIDSLIIYENDNQIGDI